MTTVTVTVSAAGVVLDSTAAIGTPLEFAVGFGHALQLLFVPLLMVGLLFVAWRMIIKAFRSDEDNV